MLMSVRQRSDGTAQFKNFRRQFTISGFDDFQLRRIPLFQTLEKLFDGFGRRKVATVGDDDVGPIREVPPIWNQF